MLQPRDIVVLLALARAPEAWTIRTLGEPIEVRTGALHRALARLSSVGLYDPARRQLNLAIVDGFVRHAARFVLARDLGKPARGIPTAWGAAPLNTLMTSSNADPAPVWPSPEGTERGPSLIPLVDNAPQLVSQEPLLAEDLTLLDAIAIGDPRIRKLAADLLMGRLATVSSNGH